jgi:hypothetical protein
MWWLVILAVILVITILVHVSSAHFKTVIFLTLRAFSLINDKFPPRRGVLKIDILNVACAKWMYKRLKVEGLGLRAMCEAGSGSAAVDGLQHNVSVPRGSRQAAAVTKELISKVLNYVCFLHFRYLKTELGRLIGVKKGNLADNRDLLAIPISAAPPTVGITYTCVKKYNGRG